MKTRRPRPLDPAQWTVAERDEVIAVYRTFTEETYGQRAFEILKRDLWDTLSAVGPSPQGQVMLDNDTMRFNEGRRHAFDSIQGYLDAHEYMVNPPAKEHQ